MILYAGDKFHKCVITRTYEYFPSYFVFRIESTAENVGIKNTWYNNIAIKMWRVAN